MTQLQVVAPTMTPNDIDPALRALIPQFVIGRTGSICGPVPNEMLKHLAVDRAYQPIGRQKENRIEFLKGHWSDNQSGTLEGSWRDGKLWIFDGATRLAGALANGEVPELWVRVIFGLDRAQEARLFRLLNQWRWAVHIVDRFKAMVEEGDVLAQRIARVLGQHGIEIGYTPSAREISAIQAIEFLAIWGVLPMTINVIATAWPEDVESRRRTILLGVGAFCYRYGDILNAPSHEGTLIKLLRRLTPSDLVRDAREMHGGRGLWSGVAEEIIYHWGRLPGAKRLPHYTQPALPRSEVSIGKPGDNNMPGNYTARNRRKARTSAAAI